MVFISYGLNRAWDGAIGRAEDERERARREMDSSRPTLDGRVVSLEAYCLRMYS